MNTTGLIPVHSSGDEYVGPIDLPVATPERKQGISVRAVAELPILLNVESAREPFDGLDHIVDVAAPSSLSGKPLCFLTITPGGARRSDRVGHACSSSKGAEVLSGVQIMLCRRRGQLQPFYVGRCGQSAALTRVSYTSASKMPRSSPLPGLSTFRMCMYLHGYSLAPERLHNYYRPAGEPTLLCVLILDVEDALCSLN